MTCARLTACRLPSTFPSCGLIGFPPNKCRIQPKNKSVTWDFSFNYPNWKKDHMNGQRTVSCEAKQILHGPSLPWKGGGLSERQQAGSKAGQHTSTDSERLPLPDNSLKSATDDDFTDWSLPKNSGKQESVDLDVEWRIMKRWFWEYINKRECYQSQEGALLESKWSMKYLKVPMGNLGKSKAMLKYLKFLRLSLFHSDSSFRSELKDHFFPRMISWHYPQTSLRCFWYSVLLPLSLFSSVTVTIIMP